MSRETVLFFPSQRTNLPGELRSLTDAPPEVALTCPVADLNGVHVNMEQAL